jgi:hypothetical protein
MLDGYVSIQGMTQMRSPDSFVFNPKVVKYITSSLVVLMCLSIGLHILFVVLFPNTPEVIQTRFNVGNEGNWPTWLNGTLFLIAGFSAFLVGLLNHHQLSSSSRRTVFGWMGIAAGLGLLAIDEQLALHDALRAIIQDFLVNTIPGFSPRLGFYMWYIVLGVPGIIIATAILYCVYRQLWRFRWPRYLIIVAILLLLSNPISEFLEDLPRQFDSNLSKSFIVLWDNIFMAIQESTEMLAPILLTNAFLWVGYEFINESQKKSDTPEEHTNSPS